MTTTTADTTSLSVTIEHIETTLESLIQTIGAVATTDQVVQFRKVQSLLAQALAETYDLVA